MRYIPFIFLSIILSCALFLSGCEMLEVQTAADGTQHTQLTDAITTAAQTITEVGSVVPGWGLIAGGVGSILALIGTGITSVMVRRKSAQNNKLSTALTTVVSGVNIAADSYDKIKENLLKIVDEKTRPEVEKIFEQYKDIKSVIQAIANNSNIEAFLKLFIKTAEANGKA